MSYAGVFGFAPSFVPRGWIHSAAFVPLTEVIGHQRDRTEQLKLLVFNKRTIARGTDRWFRMNLGSQKSPQQDVEGPSVGV